MASGHGFLSMQVDVRALKEALWSALQNKNDSEVKPAGISFQVFSCLLPVDTAFLWYSPVSEIIKMCHS